VVDVARTPRMRRTRSSNHDVPHSDSRSPKKRSPFLSEPQAFMGLHFTGNKVIHRCACSRKRWNNPSQVRRQGYSEYNSNISISSQILVYCFYFLIKRRVSLPRSQRYQPTTPLLEEERVPSRPTTYWEGINITKGTARGNCQLTPWGLEARV
jgi:hypothetical protein